MMMLKNKAPHEAVRDSPIYIRHHWYERPVFVGLCFSLIVVACFFIGEHTSTKPQVASASNTAATTTEITPVKKNIKIAAVGDSNTTGTGVSTKEQKTLSYPAQLQQKLGSYYEVSNFGVSGTTLLNNTNAPYALQESYKESKELSPDVVLIMLGTNDVRSGKWNVSEYKTQFIDFINEYKKLPSLPQVYILTPPAMFTEDNLDPTLKNETVPEVYAIAEKTGSKVIDVYSATKNRHDLIVDGVHPNGEGYGIIADTVFKAMMQ